MEFSAVTARTRRAQLYIIRHGETVANVANILQGHCDYPLTDLGQVQALNCGKRLKEQQWDKIYASDLPRAHSTCQLILSQNVNRYPPESITTTTLLRELCFGIREALPREVTTRVAREATAKRLGIPVEDVVDNTETPPQVRRRQKQFLKELGLEMRAIQSSLPASRDLDAEPIQILCVSHGGFIKSLLRNFCPMVVTPIKIGNCAVTLIEIEWPDSVGPQGMIVTDPTKTVFTCTTREGWVNKVGTLISAEEGGAPPATIFAASSQGWYGDGNSRVGSLRSSVTVESDGEGAEAATVGVDATVGLDATNGPV